MARIKPQALLIQSKKKKGPTRISITTIITCNLIFVLIMWCSIATYRKWSQRSSNQHEEYGLPNLQDVDAKKFDLPGYAILSTSKGSITVELYKDGSSEIVDRFLDLCQKGHFKGMPFHHVIKNYVIQGGDVQREGAVEEWTSKVKPSNQISPKHEAFMLGTSKTKQDSEVFELFITTAPIPDLNDKLSVFGRVIKGEDIVQEIEEVDTDEHYRPKSPVGIINVTLKRQI